MHACVYVCMYACIHAVLFYLYFYLLMINSIKISSIGFFGSTEVYSFLIT